MTTPPEGIGPGNRIAEFGPFVLFGTRLRNGDTEQALTGLHATVEATGAVTRRTTATRVIAGGALFGPAGAIVGAVARKREDQRELYLHIDGPDHYWVEAVDPRKGAEARQFVASIQNAARWEW